MKLLVFWWYHLFESDTDWKPHFECSDFECFDFECSDFECCALGTVLLIPNLLNSDALELTDFEVTFKAYFPYQCSLSDEQDRQRTYQNDFTCFLVTTYVGLRWNKLRFEDYAENNPSNEVINHPFQYVDSVRILTRSNIHRILLYPFTLNIIVYTKVVVKNI